MALYKYVYDYGYDFYYQQLRSEIAFLSLYCHTVITKTCLGDSSVGTCVCLSVCTITEAFIKRSWYSVLPVLDATGRRRVKKAVVCVAQLVAAFITVHDLLSFLSDVYGLFDFFGTSKRQTG